MNKAIVPDYVQNANYALTGQIWTPDQQCKMIYGSQATFCPVNILKN